MPTTKSDEGKALELYVPHLSTLFLSDFNHSYSELVGTLFAQSPLINIQASELPSCDSPVDWTFLASAFTTPEAGSVSPLHVEGDDPTETVLLNLEEHTSLDDGSEV